MSGDYEDLLAQFMETPETVDRDVLEVFNYEYGTDPRSSVQPICPR